MTPEQVAIGMQSFIGTDVSTHSPPDRARRLTRGAHTAFGGRRNAL